MQQIWYQEDLLQEQNLLARVVSSGCGQLENTKIGLKMIWRNVLFTYELSIPYFSWMIRGFLHKKKKTLRMRLLKVTRLLKRLNRDDTCLRNTEMKLAFRQEATKVLGLILIKVNRKYGQEQQHEIKLVQSSYTLWGKIELWAAKTVNSLRESAEEEDLALVSYLVFGGTNSFRNCVWSGSSSSSESLLSGSLVISVFSRRHSTFSSCS